MRSPALGDLLGPAVHRLGHQTGPLRGEALSCGNAVSRSESLSPKSVTSRWKTYELMCEWPLASSSLASQASCPGLV